MINSNLNNIKDAGTPDDKHHTHDPDYYYHDGSVVFLVGDVLFKIHASRFTPHSSNEVFTGLPSTTTPTNPVNAVTQTKGSSDFDPVVLPEFEAKQFRSFLYLFYGSPIEPKFKKILEGGRFGSLPEMSKYYMDVAIISHHFGMGDTRSWALRWLRQMLDSPNWFEYSYWTSPQLLQGLRYAKLMNECSLENNIRFMLGVHCLIRFSPRPESFYLAPPATVSHPDPRDLLDVLYRNATLRLEDRSLFGQILCIILHTGHKSLIWTEGLTRNERATLFATQVCLTPLPKLVDYSWLESPDRTNKTGDETITCSDTCKNIFEHVWKLVFNEACEQFRLTTPLGGIDALCNLIMRRGHFHVKISSPTSLAVDEKRMVCGKCRTNLLKKLDSKLDQVFSGLVDLFEQVERDGYIV